MTRNELLIGIGISLLIGVFLSPFASSFPDGLERVAEDLGFIAAAQDSALPGIIPDYEMPGIDSPTWATALAGFVGTLIMYFAGFFIARVLSKSQVSAPADDCS